MATSCKSILTFIFGFGLFISSYGAISHNAGSAVVGCSYNFTTSISGSNYSWDFGPNSYPRTLSGAAFQTGTSVFLTPGSHTIRVIITTGGGPVGDSVTINVSPSASNTTLSTNAPLCITKRVTFTAGGGMNYIFLVNDSVYQVGPGNTFSYNIKLGDSIRAVAQNGPCFSNPSPTLYESSPQPPTVTSTLPLGDTICAGDLVTFTAMPSSYDSFLFYVGGSLQRVSNTNTWNTSTLSDSNQITVFVRKNGCANYFWSNTITVHVKPTPQMTLTASDTVICQGTPVTFTASALQTSTDSFNFWINSVRAQTSATNNTYVTSTLNNNDTVTVTGNRNGCQSRPSNALIIRVNSAPTVAISSSDANDSICQNESVTFTATPATYSNYQFFNGSISVQNSASPTFTTTALTNGNAIYVIASSPGCPPSTSDTISTAITPAPAVDAGTPNQSACIYADADTLTGFTPAGGTWSGAGIDATGLFTPATAGAGAHTVTYTYTDIATGCTASDNVTYTVFARPNITINPANPAICQGQSITIAASGANTYVWGPANGLSDTTIANPVASPAATTTYTVTGTDNNNCSNTANANVAVSQLSEVDYTVTPGCTGKETVFTLTAPPPQGSTLTWYFGDGTTSNLTNPTHIYTSDNTYTVVLVAQQGICADTVSQSIVVYPGADAGFEAAPTVAYVGDSIQFTSSTPGINTYAWDLGDGSISDVPAFAHTYQEAGLYTVSLVVSNQAGCADSLTKVGYILIYRKPKIFVPNAFTPDESGNNDVLHVFADGLRYLEWSIYNRLGEKVYESNNVNPDVSEGWDGTYKGVAAPQGVYTYTLKAVFDDNTTRNYKGSVTLLR